MDHKSYYNNDKSNIYFEIAKKASFEFKESIEWKKINKYIGLNYKICEFGCGEATKLSTFYDAKQGIELYGVDISREGVTQGKAIYPYLNLSNQDIEKTDFSDNFFDITMSFYVYEHLQDPEKTFIEMLRTTKKGGKIVLLFPNFGSPLFPSPPSLYGLSAIQKIILIMKRIFNGETHRFSSVAPITEVEYQSDYDTVSEINMRKFIKHITKEYKVEIPYSSSSRYQVNMHSNKLLWLYFPLKLLSYMGIGEFLGPTAFLVIKKK